MRKLFLPLAMITFIAGTISATMGQAPLKPLVQPQEGLIKTNEVTSLTNVVPQDTLTDYQKFTKLSETRLLANENTVAALRLRISAADSTKKVDNGVKLDILEMRNASMRKELNLYKVEGQEEWIAYKEQFTKDLEKLTSELTEFKTD